MKKGKVRNRPLLISFIAVALLAVLIIISSWGSTAGRIENVIGVIVTPIQGFASRTSENIADFFRGLFNTTDLDKENEQLKEDLALYEQDKLRLEELERENARLKELMGYIDELGDYKYCTAKIVAKSTGIWFRTFTLNVGRNAGIAVDMAVISSDGLVGKVSEVGSTWCKVTAVIDSSMTIPVMVERTRDNCMIRGLLDPSNTQPDMELYYLPSDRADLSPGDVIITSGIGDVYPKGLLVGTVSEVLSGNTGTSAIILPAVDFVHLEEVAVIVGTGGSN